MAHEPLTIHELRQAAGRLPRVSLAHLPTPLEEERRFVRRLAGPRILIKRDDCTGMLFGGNKTRHNEFLLGEALKQNADVLVWGAGVQSNNCRQTAAACNKLGLDCHLYLSRASHNDDVQGNLLLDHLMGATIHIIDTPMGPELDDLLLAKAKELRLAGRRPFVWDRVKGRPIAAVSYALCLAEILEQSRCPGHGADPCVRRRRRGHGSGPRLGKAILGWQGKLRLLCPIRWPWDTPADMAEVGNHTASLLGLPHRLTAAEIDISNDYMGPATATSRPQAGKPWTCWPARKASCSNPSTPPRRWPP